MDVSLLHQKYPFPPVTVSQKSGWAHRSWEAPTNKVQHREPSADGDLTHHFTLATHETLVSVSVLPLLPLSPQILLPHRPALCCPHSGVPLTSCLTYREGRSSRRSERAGAFAKSDSVFPSCRTSNRASASGPRYPCCHLVNDYLGPGCTRWQGTCGQTRETDVL